MATVLLTRPTAGHFTARLNAVSPNSQRKWGSMTPHDLMAHLRRAIEVSLGDHPVEDKSVPVVRDFLRFMIFQAIPTTMWPKGKIKAPPVFLAPPQGSFEEERRKLDAAIDRFVATAEEDPERLGPNPLLGPLPLTYWARIHGRHFDHHLRQFGA